MESVLEKVLGKSKLSSHEELALLLDKDPKEASSELGVSELDVKEIVNVSGRKLFLILCPKCNVRYAFVAINNFFRHEKRFHSEKIEPRVNKPVAKLTESRRVFYVDAAQSIKSKEGVRYWRVVLVESDKCLAGSANGKVRWAIEAEAFAVLNAFYWIIANKVFETAKEIAIGSDSKVVVRVLKGWDLAKVRKEHFRNNYKDKKKSHFYKYAYVIKKMINKLISKHNVQIKFFWIKGADNPADYYSRIPYKSWSPRQQGKESLK